MPNLYIKNDAHKVVSQKLYESKLSVSDISERLSLNIEETYEMLIGVKQLTFSELMELAFYLEIKLDDLVVTKFTAIELIVECFDQLIKSDRDLGKRFNKAYVVNRIQTFICFIKYESSIA